MNELWEIINAEYARQQRDRISMVTPTFRLLQILNCADTVAASHIHPGSPDVAPYLAKTIYWAMLALRDHAADPETFLADFIKERTRTT